jgi:hypothetical protein
LGDPDLSPGGSPPGGSPPTAAGPVSLSDLIRAGDADAFAGFRDAHIEMVHRYCEVACPPERVVEACEAAFLDFLARVRDARAGGHDLEGLLLVATRSAAARRFAIPRSADQPGRGHRHPASSQLRQICAAMPDLLAARANGELRSGDRVVAHHLASCAICAAGEARMRAAAEAFAPRRDG